jgi:hypothetical protein
MKRDYTDPVVYDVLQRRGAVKKMFQDLLSDPNSYNPFLKDKEVQKLKRYGNCLAVFVRAYQEEGGYPTQIVGNGISEENLDLLFGTFQKPYEDAQEHEVVHALAFTEYMDIECGFINLEDFQPEEAASLNAGFEQIKTIMEANNIGIN